MLLHFCLSISIISKISRSQTTRVAARPFVSFASAKVGKNHPNFQIHTKIHTTKGNSPTNSRAYIIYNHTTKQVRSFFLLPHLTPQLSRGRSIHCKTFIRRSLRMILCRGPCTLFRVLRYRVPSSPICLFEETHKPFALSRVFLLSSGGKSIVRVKDKAPSRSAFPLSMYVVLKTRQVNPNIHVRRY